VGEVVVVTTSRTVPCSSCNGQATVPIVPPVKLASAVSVKFGLPRLPFCGSPGVSRLRKPPIFPPPVWWNLQQRAGIRLLDRVLVRTGADTVGRVCAADVESVRRAASPFNANHS
jgi:hypothetical protein